MTGIAALLWLSVSVAGAPPAADTLRGTVSDTAGAPVPGVAVDLAELERTAVTGSDGAFAFVDLPAGRYTLVARRVGFAPVVRAVSVPAATDLRLVMRASPFPLDAVSVTATRLPTATLYSPLPLSTLSGDRLRLNGDVSLAQALGELAGVRTLSTGGEIGKPVIRGLSGARVLTLEDGMRLEDYSWSAEDGPSADPDLAQRVEVIRGPASVLYGSDAIGGVLNVLPEPLPGARGRAPYTEGAAEIYGASNNTEGGSAVRLEGAKGGFGWRAGLTGRISGALSTPLGELENTNFTSLNGEGAAGTQGAWGKAELRVIHYGGEFHLLEADTAAAPPPPAGGADQGPVRKLSDDRVQATTMLPLGGIRLEVKTQWQRHSLVEVTGGDTSSKDRGFDLLLNTGTVDLLAHHGGGALRGTVGFSGLVQRNDTRGPEPLVPGVTTTGAAAFVFEEATLGRWSLLAGLRGDARHLAADSNAGLALGHQTRDYTAWTGDVGLVLRPVDGLALAANVGRAWRAPTLFELFANGLEIGEARFEVGDRTLVPEAGVDADLSVRWEGDRVRGQVAAYHNRIGHYIYIAPTGGTQDSFPVFQYRQADAALWGGEVEVATEPWPTLTLSLRGDYVRGTQSDGTPLPLMPPVRGRLEAEWHQVALGWADRLAFGAAVEAVGRQTRLAPYDIPTGRYTLLDLSGSLARRFGTLPLRFDLQVRNAADTRYRDFLSRYKAFALNPGRNVIVRCSTTF